MTTVQFLTWGGLVTYAIAFVLALMLASDLWKAWKQSGRQIARDFAIVSLAWAVWAVTGGIGICLSLVGNVDPMIVPIWGTVVRLSNLAMVCYAFYTIKIKK